MSIDEAYQFLNFLANSRQSGKITPANFNLAIQRAGMQFFLNEIKKWQDSQVVTDAISPFIDVQILNISSNGQVPYPTFYVDTIAVRHLYYKPNGSAIEVPVVEVNNSAIGEVSQSEIVAPTKRYPNISYYTNYMQFLPKDIGNAIYEYFRLPIDPIWNFTVVNNRPVYNPATSVQLEFRDKDHNEIVMITAGYLGLNLSMPELLQGAELFKAQNN